MTIIKDIPYEKYEAMPELRPSMLKHMLRSAKRMKRALNGECQPNPRTVAVGNATHCLLAGELENRFVIMPPFHEDADNLTANGKQSTSKATKYYKEKVEIWEAENAGKEHLLQVEVTIAAKVATLVRKHAGQIIDHSDQEVVVTGAIDGLPMKTRIDGLLDDGEGISCWDLKITKDAADSAFYRICKNLNYLFSAAVHIELLRQNDIEVEEYRFLVAENEGDFSVRWLRVPMIVFGDHLNRVKSAVKNYKEAVETDDWPGLSDSELYIPNWDLVSEDELEWN